MKPSHLLVLFLLPVLTNGLEMAVGTDNGLLVLESSGENYNERKLGDYTMLRSTIPTLAFDATRGFIYFAISKPSDGVLVQAIESSPGQEDDLEMKTIIQKSQGPETIRGLVYDDVGDALYWTDIKKREISMIGITEALESKNVTVIHKFEDNKHLSGIAIDVCRRLLFWTNDNHLNPSVERSYVNGSGSIVIASTNLYMPITLAVDPAHDGRLFWADIMSSDFKIEMSHLDGSGRVTLFKRHGQTPFSLSYLPSDNQNTHSGILLWTDNLNDVIWEMAVPGVGENRNMDPKSIHNFKKFSTLGMIARVSFDTDHQSICGENSAANITIVIPASIEKNFTTNAVTLTEPTKLKQFPFSPEEPTTRTNDPVTTPKDVERTEPTSPPPQHPTPTTEFLRKDSRDANSLRLRQFYCINGEPVVDGNRGPLGCNCSQGYSGPRCEKSLCDNYCIHGSCSLEQGSGGQWGAKCTCRLGFTGRRCERDPCLNFCLNGGQCRINSGGKPKCSCPGNGQLVRGERCELFPNLLEDFCTLLCSQDDSKTSVSFVPLERKDDEVGDAERPLCVCPSGKSQYIYSATKGGLNATTERASVETMPILSPIVLALVGVCIILLSTSLFLTYKVMKLRRLPRIKKRIIVSKGAVPLAAGCGGSRGRSPSAGSSVLGEQQQCEITIENCCNMNICETPCFEPQLRSPGTSGNSKKTTTKEERKVLLVNMEGPKSSCGPCTGGEELY